MPPGRVAPLTLLPILSPRCGLGVSWLWPPRRRLRCSWSRLQQAAGQRDRPGVPNKTGVYAACYAKAGGAMRITPTFRRCRANEFRVTWSKRGPVGPQGAAGAMGTTGPQGQQGNTGPQGSQGATGAAGPAGPAGATGATGATGAAGPAGSQLVTGTPVTSAPAAARQTLITATATCPVGKVLLGGGARITTTATQKDRAELVSSYPSAADTWTAIGVVAIAALPATQTMTVTAYALCSL